MKEKIGTVLATIGAIITVLGFCCLDSSEQYINQIYLFTICGLVLVGVGGIMSQLFD